MSAPYPEFKESTAIFPKWYRLWLPILGKRLRWPHQPNIIAYGWRGKIYLVRI